MKTHSKNNSLLRRIFGHKTCLVFLDFSYKHSELFSHNSIFGLCSHSCKRQLIVSHFISDGSPSSHARQAATTQDCTDATSASHHAVLIPSIALTCLHQDPELAWGKKYRHSPAPARFLAGPYDAVVISSFGSDIKIGISL